LLSSVSDQSVLEANYQLEQGLRLAEKLLPVSSPFAASKEQASEFPASEHEEDISKLEKRMSGLIGDIEKGVERTREKVEGQMGRRDKGDYKELCVRLEAALRKHQDEADTIQRLHYQEMEELKAQHSLQLQSLQSSLQKTLKDQEILSNSQENVRNLMRELKKANEVIANVEKWKDEKKELEAELRKMSGENSSLRARLASLQATNHAFSQQLAAYKSSMSGSVSELSTEVQRISKLQERLEIREERMKMTIADLEGVIGARLRTERQETMPLPTQISAVQSFSKLNTSQEAANVSQETEYDLSGLGRMIEEECEVSDSHKARIFECVQALVLSTGRRELLTAVERLQTQLLGQTEGA
jgi:DNA repair exonuclease SbcCD ATPase subunit